MTQTQDSAFRQDVSVWGKKQSLPYMDLGPMAEPFLRSIKARKHVSEQRRTHTEGHVQGHVQIPKGISGLRDGP